MSFSLQLRHGDLALNGNSFGTVSGGEKLVQDLRCALLTPLGSYEEEPTFGSTLDDETDNSIIGQINGGHAAALVQAEITRICTDYQKQQISRNQSDGATYGRLTIGSDEMLLSVEKIDMTRNQDRLLAHVTLQVGTGFVTVQVPVNI